MANSNSSFGASFFCVVLVVALLIGIFTANSILIYIPIILIVLFILFLLITTSSVKTVKPENFLAMTDDYVGNEKSFVKLAKKMLEEQKDERVFLFLKGLIAHYSKDTEKPIVGLTLNDQQSNAYKKLIEEFNALSKCDKIWYISSSSMNTGLLKSPVSNFVERKETAFACSLFNHVSTAVSSTVPMLRDLQYSYYIYPDFIVKAKSPIAFEIISIEQVVINYSPQRFVESEYNWQWPKDSKVVDYTYQFVNKNGTPDLRYGSNKRLPIYLYGNVTIRLLGLALTYQTSRNELAEKFVQAYNLYLRSIILSKTDIRINNERINPNHSYEYIDDSRNTIPPRSITIESLDSLFNPVARFIVKNQSASTSMIQREFSIGYNRASRIMDMLEKTGIVESFIGSGSRKVLVNDLNVLEQILSRITTNDTTKRVSKYSYDNIFGISKVYFDNVKSTVCSFARFYQKLEADNTIMTSIENSLPEQYGEKKNKFLMLVFSDLMKNYQKMGYDISDLKNKEGFAIVLLTGYMLETKNYFNNVRYERINLFDEMTDNVVSMFNSLKNAFQQYPEDNFFFIAQVLNHCNRDDLVTSYFSEIYRLFSIIAKADGSINDTEKEWLNKLIGFNKGYNNNGKMNFEVSSEISIKEDNKMYTQELTDPISELNKLIGLDNVKTEINNLSNLIKIQKIREGRGMKSSNITYHSVFTGNPGTGKTTVARILAKIYKQLGVLKKGHLVETDRSGLVADYVGQTSSKTNAIIDSALDGVLFIDEAYSLIQGGQSDYGKEAISTLLKRMEDDRERLVVILAGYTKEMADFINSNSGLQSRFNHYIDFPDYSSEELMLIFEFITKSNEYVASKEALACIKDYIDKTISNKDKNFGNARFIRNLFERILTQQANRLTDELNISNEMLSRIEVVDVKNAIV